MVRTFFKKHRYIIGVAVMIVSLVIYKSSVLSLPYFWDEAWPYSVAVGTLYDHGLSFMPDAIPAEISRGHPLMFFFLAAGWMKIFGVGQVSGHCFALLVSALTVTSIYIFCRRFFSERVGFIAGLMFSCQAIFISQATFLLPEMLMALWTLLAFYFYFSGSKIWFIVFASAMLLTKESGAVLVLTLALYELVSFAIQRNKSVKSFILKVILISAPVLIAGIYFVIQKVVHGWFLFPFHMQYISSRWTDFQENLPTAATYMFIYYGRNAFSVLVILSLISCIFFQKQTFTIAQRKILAMFGCYIVAYLMFSSINQFIPRYLLCAFPPFIIAGAALIDKVVVWRFWIRDLVLVGLCGTALFFYFEPGKRNGDIDWSPSIRTDLAVVRYCERAGLSNSHIFAPAVLRIDFQEPYAGYLSGQRFKNIQYEVNGKTEYCIFNGDEYDEGLANTLKNNNHMVLVKRFSEKYAWKELYKVVR